MSLPCNCLVVCSPSMQGQDRFVSDKSHILVTVLSFLTALAVFPPSVLETELPSHAERNGSDIFHCQYLKTGPWCS